MNFSFENAEKVIRNLSTPEYDPKFSNYDRIVSELKAKFEGLVAVLKDEKFIYSHITNTYTAEMKKDSIPFNLGRSGTSNMKYCRSLTVPVQEKMEILMESTRANLHDGTLIEKDLTKSSYVLVQNVGNCIKSIRTQQILANIDKGIALKQRSVAIGNDLGSRLESYTNNVEVSLNDLELNFPNLIGEFVKESFKIKRKYKNSLPYVPVRQPKEVSGTAASVESEEEDDDIPDTLESMKLMKQDLKKDSHQSDEEEVDKDDEGLKTTLQEVLDETKQMQEGEKYAMEIFPNNNLAEEMFTGKLTKNKRKKLEKKILAILNIKNKIALKKEKKKKVQLSEAKLDAYRIQVFRYMKELRIEYGTPVSTD